MTTTRDTQLVKSARDVKCPACPSVGVFVMHRDEVGCATAMECVPCGHTVDAFEAGRLVMATAARG